MKLILLIIMFSFIIDPVLGIAVFSILALSKTQTSMNIKHEYIAIASGANKQDNNELWLAK